MSSTTEITQENKSSDLGTTVLNITKKIKWKFLIVMAAMPNSTFWNMFILATSVLNYILVTTNLSFLPTEVAEFFSFYVIFDVIYLFNFLLLLSQKIFHISNTFYTEKTMFIIFVVDFVSLVSQAMLIIPFVSAHKSFLVLIFRVITFVRLRHLLVFNKVLRRLTEYRIVWILGKYITTVVIIIHTAICLWFLIKSEDNFYDELPEFKSGEVPASNASWYFYHIYATIQLLMNVGFGDVYPKNINEIYFFSMMFLVGQALTVYFICVVGWIIINQNYHKFSIYYQIKNVKKYLNGSHPLIKQTADKYFSMKEHKQFTDRSLLDMLPRCLQQDIAYDLNCGLLHRSLLLSNLPKFTLRNISSEMKTVILPAGESIYFQYVVKSGMVCIEDGALEILHDDDEESPVIYFRTGTIFGEISLFLNIPSKVTVRAAKRTELRILEKKDFLKVMLHFPQQLKYLHTALKLRLNNVPKQNSFKTRVQNLRKIKNMLSFGSIDENGMKDTNFYELYKLEDQYLRDNRFDEYNWIHH
ncbi:cGMP-gated cation channel alpha-1-like [Diabrotica virgifera virgifera]|uniref:Cyclic nucleotide-binding domain-containing protein n=1 Tax=Diabrotica virgifera virgifera TaxID=50390 RepID=A0ABM5L7J0_DIAVI|nr:cGMP-gated cation channel alpha-1-like [Diabrotica virgifera virgifera]